MTDYVDVDEDDEFYPVAFGIVFLLFQFGLLLFWVDPILVDLPNTLSGYFLIFITSLSTVVILILTLNLFPSFYWSFREIQRLTFIIFYPFYIYMVVLSLAYIRDSVKADNIFSPWEFLRPLKNPFG